MCSVICTDFCLCTFGSVPLLNIIEYRKLVFLGQLCRLPGKYLAKNVFNLRLIRFFNYDKQTRGFVPEIYKLLSKYGLTFVLSMYVRSGAFPSVVRWKTFLNQVVFESTKLTQYNRLCDRYSRDLVRRVCNDKDVSQIWKFSRSTPTAAKTCQTSMCMFSELARDYK